MRSSDDAVTSNSADAVASESSAAVTSDAGSDTGISAASMGVLRWLVAAAFVVILNETITMTAVPRLMEHFGVGATAAQWLSTIFLLTMAVVIPITGWFLQRVTTRTAFMLAMGVFLVGTALAAIAWAFPVLLVARVIQAAGTAVMFPLLMTTLMEIVPPHQRGRVMGYVTLAISVAPALGPAVSGVVLHFLDWRWIFLVVLPIAAAITIGGLRGLTNVGTIVVSSVDWLSVVLAAVGFGGLVYGLSEFANPAARSLAIVWTVVGVIGIAVFAWRQARLVRGPGPLLDLRTLRIDTFRTSLALLAIGFMGMLASMLLLQLYLQDVRDLGPLETGLLVMPGGLAMGLLGPVIGRLYDLHGARRLVRPGAVVFALAMAGFAFFGSTTPIWLVLVLHVVLMLSLSFVFTPLFTVGLGALPHELYSHGSSLLGTIQQVAGALGTAVSITVMTLRTVDLQTNGVPEIEAAAGGMSWGFAAAAVTAFVGMILAFRIPARPTEPAHSAG